MNESFHPEVNFSPVFAISLNLDYVTVDQELIMFTGSIPLE